MVLADEVNDMFDVRELIPLIEVQYKKTVEIYFFELFVLQILENKR